MLLQQRKIKVNEFYNRHVLKLDTYQGIRLTFVSLCRKI